jgi:outer membrane protein TolC
MNAFGIIGLLMAAQSNAPLTLSEAIRLSEAHSVSVSTAKAQVRAARARVGIQGSQQLPQLNFSGSATRYDNKTDVSFAGNTIELLPDHQETLEVALTQDFDISGRVGASVAQAKLYALSAGYGYQAAEADQALSTTSAFYTARRALESVRVAQDSLEAYKQQLELAKKLAEGGVGQKIDVYRAESQVADAERELFQRENELRSASSALNDLIGRPLDETIEIAEPTAATEAPTQDEDADRTALIAKALDHRPEALAASVALQAAKKGIAIARSAQGPDLSFSAAGYHYPTTSFQSPRSNVGAFTLSVSVPLFDGGLAREQINEAHAEVEVAVQQQDQVRRDIALDVQNASLDVQTARKRLAAANVDLTAAQQARKLAQERYEAQVGLYLEITDSQAALTSAEAAVVDATYDLLIAQARLSRAVSEPILH